MNKQAGEFMTPAGLNKRWGLQPKAEKGTQEFKVMGGRINVQVVPHARWNGKTKEKDLGFMVSSEVLPKQHQYGG